VDRFGPRYADLSGPEPTHPLDRWLVSRTSQLVGEATAGYEAFLAVDVVRAFDSFVDDLSNWYIRRSRRRFWDGDEAALRTLWHALVHALQVISPVMPFLAEHLWRNLVAEPCAEAPRSVFLAPWPEVRDSDEQLLAEVAEVRRVVELGYQARSGSSVRLRQPLRRLVVQGASLAERYADEIRSELRVKEVEFGEVDAMQVRVKPNLPVLGPKLGKALGAVRRALEEGRFQQLEDGRIAVSGLELGPDEVLVERSPAAGWALAEANGVTVALSTDLDDDLRLEARVLDLIHQLNRMRREAGLELTDRIVVTLPEEQSDLLAHADWIKREVLAVAIETDGGLGEPQIAKA
jgi:isoleucyl-tRNA synthetase